MHRGEVLNVVISGHYGGINLGDDAIICSLAEALRKLYGDSVSITALSHNPDVTKQNAHVYAVPQISFSRRIINELYGMMGVIRKSDCVLIGGGGLLQDEFNIHTIPRYLLPALLGKIRGKTVVFYALGVGPLNRSYSINCIKLVSRQVDYVTVRDPESKQIMEQLGVGNIDVVPDPAVCLPRCRENRTLEILRAENIELNERPRIGVSLRGIYHTHIKGNSSVKVLSKDHKRSIREGLERVARETDGVLVFVCTDNVLDKGISEEMARECGCEARIIKGQYPPDEFAGIVGAMDMVMSMPLHSAVIATACNVPVLAVEYNAKVRNFMRQIGLEDCVLAMDNLNALDRKAMQVFQDRKVIRDHLAEQTRRLQEESLKALQRTLQRIRTGGKPRNLFLILVSAIYMGCGLVAERLVHKIKSLGTGDVRY